MGVNEWIKIGERMKEERKKSGMTQREMAKRLNLSFSTYSNYENNYREPPMDIIKNFCEILSLSVDDLLNHATNKDKSGYYVSFPEPSEKFYKLSEAAQFGFLETLLFLGFDPDIVFKYYKVTFTKELLDKMHKTSSLNDEIFNIIKKNTEESESQP